MGTGADAGTMAQNTEYEMRLCEKKCLQIQEFLRTQNLGLAGNANNQDNGIVKCQCGWDGEEPAMVSSTEYGVDAYNKHQTLRLSDYMLVLQHASAHALLWICRP